MSGTILEKPNHSKCADAIEFGESFGKYSRISKFQFAMTFDEKYSSEGMNYKIKKRFDNNNHFIVRIIRPKPEGILLALWKTGKISFSTNSSTGQTGLVDIIKK